MIVGQKRPATHGRLRIWVIAASSILLPLLAVRGLEAQAWDAPGDFLLLGILLVATGMVTELAIRVPHRHAFRAGTMLAVLAAGLLAWINLAVGVIGSEDDHANLVYAGVVAVAGTGAVLARFEARGMAQAMTATAAAQLAAFVTLFVAGWGFTGPLTTFFVATWLSSAWAFRRAASAS